VPQYYRGAAKWHARAAWQGEPNAQYFLGMAYDKGRGVPRDEILAYMWLDLAAGSANERARDYYTGLRDAVASKLSPGQIAEGQWLAHQWRPVVER
jgi:TPR repeat protein